MRAPQLRHDSEKPPSIGGSILSTTVLPQLGHVTDTIIIKLFYIYDILFQIKTVFGKESINFRKVYLFSKYTCYVVDDDIVSIILR